MNQPTPDTPLPPADTATDPAAAPHEAPYNPVHRPLRSYVLRTGRTTVGQARAFEALGPRFILPYQSEAIDFVAVCGRSAPTVLEIGFGMGEATAQIAALRPGDNFLCCEVHPPGVGALLMRIDAQGLSNIRIVQHDAVEVIDHMLPECSLDGVHIFFPDPWHKKRHNKRRLIQPPLVAKLAARLKPGGYLHCATDWQPYAEQMLEVLRAEPLLANRANVTSGSKGHEGNEENEAGASYATKPDYRPLTKFENRGLKLGHGVWDLVFSRL